jgi:hypothetical protein
MLLPAMISRVPLPFLCSTGAVRSLGTVSTLLGAPPAACQEGSSSVPDRALPPAEQQAEQPGCELPPSLCGEPKNKVYRLLPDVRPTRAAYHHVQPAHGRTLAEAPAPAMFLTWLAAAVTAQTRQQARLILCTAEGIVCKVQVSVPTSRQQQAGHAATLT